jgi:hypothetical protein
MSLFPKSRNLRNHALTRVELLTVVVTVAMITMVASSAMARPHSVSRRSLCANNLRMISRAYQVWGSAQDEMRPWMVPYGAGTRGLDPRLDYSWLQFVQLSNELSTPKILACPEDAEVRPARAFGFFSPGALESFGYREQSVSYTAGLHSMLDTPSVWLGSDRNIRGDAKQYCEIGGVDSVSVSRTGDSALAWTNGAVHGEAGNLLLTDGSVEFTSTPTLRQRVLSNPAEPLEKGSSHFLRAR